MAQIIVPTGGAPATPSTGKVTIYAKSDKLIYSKDDAGNETVVNGAAALVEIRRLFNRIYLGVF